MSETLITIRDVIKQLTPARVASECGVSLQTVYNWMSYRSCPTPDSCHKLVKLSMGILSYESIHTQYAESREKAVEEEFNKLQRG